jgi:hypothetical protein
MDFRMQKDLSFHFTLDEREFIAFHNILQKLDFGYGNKIKEFEITEDELNLIDSLEKYIWNSEAFEELRLEDKITLKE